MLTIVEAFLIAGGVVLVLLLLLETVARVAQASFLNSVILGQDNRTSTSKTFVFMWTLLVTWALISMLIVGELIKIHSCAASLATAQQVTSAISTCTTAKDQVGLLQIGWHNFVASGLSGGYLVLLGVPASAAVAAKAITQSKNDSGVAPKSVASSGTKIAGRVAQIFSADDNTTDIGDLQYVIFNLITAVYFVAEFVRPSSLGLPDLPDTLLGLTSVSAALYVGKKAATRTQPTITGVFPSILRPGAQVVITGSGLTAESTAPPPALGGPRVTFNGVTAGGVALGPSAGTVTATVPQSLVPAGGPSSISGTVQVLNPYGAVTAGFTVELSA